MAKEVSVEEIENEMKRSLAAYFDAMGTPVLDVTGYTIIASILEPDATRAVISDSDSNSLASDILGRAEFAKQLVSMGFV